MGSSPERAHFKLSSTDLRPKNLLVHQLTFPLTEVSQYTQSGRTIVNMNSLAGSGVADFIVSIALLALLLL